MHALAHSATILANHPGQRADARSTHTHAHLPKHYSQIIGDVTNLLASFVIAQILKNIKGAVDARVSVAHSATILANALMHAGTSIDTFLRENLEWLSRATNWAKFSATAGLGVIHRGQLQQGECDAAA
jgi:hypothetical protein